jgi:hypothetical protein
MNPGYVTGVAALAGAALGGLTSSVSSIITMRSQTKAQRVDASRTRRQGLYKNFIEEAARVYIDSLMHDSVDLSGLISLYSLISQMRVVSSEPVIKSADRVALTISDTYRQPNRTLDDLEAMVKDGSIDFLHEFSTVCRQEFDLEADYDPLSAN